MHFKEKYILKSGKATDVKELNVKMLKMKMLLYIVCARKTRAHMTFGSDFP